MRPSFSVRRLLLSLHGSLQFVELRHIRAERDGMFEIVGGNKKIIFKIMNDALGDIFPRLAGDQGSGRPVIF